LASGTDKAALKLSDAAHDRQHQPANVGRGVAPAIAEADEPTAPLLQFANDVVQVSGRSRNAVQFRDGYGIARLEHLHQLG
jgi:hypothetical protein